MSEKIFKIIQTILLIIVLIVFCFSLYKVVTIVMEYQEGRKEYSALEELVKIETETMVSESEEETVADDIETEAEIQTTTEAEEIVIRYHDNFVNVDVDFKTLENINSDFEGWLYVPGLSISYPVVLGTDNDYYLTHTFQKGENSAGALFLDQATTNPFENYNTIIHGHNMKNGSMFGKLKNFYRDTKTYADNPYFYVYTDGKAYKYFIFSYYVTNATSDTYQLPGSEEAYQSYKDYVTKSAVYQELEGIPDSAPIVTLSTCYGDTYTDLRLVVHGILVATK